MKNNHLKLFTWDPIEQESDNQKRAELVQIILLQKKQKGLGVNVHYMKACLFN